MNEIPAMPDGGEINAAVLAIHQNSLAGKPSIIQWNADLRAANPRVGLDVLNKPKHTDESRLVVEMGADVKDPLEIRYRLIDAIRDKYPQKGLDVYL